MAEVSSGNDSKQPPNPKYCRISLFANDEDEQYSLENSKTVPNPTLYRMKDILPTKKLVPESYTHQVMQLILDHYNKYGTIQEVRLVGHGCKGEMGDGSANSQLIISWLLDDLSLLEQRHGKIVNRIVFDGCNTFSNIDDATIVNYSTYAKQQSIQLVGTTSTIADVGIGIHWHVGRYVQFTPDGKITRDALDTRYNPSMLFLDSDQSWTDFFIGKNIDEGVKLQKANNEIKGKSNSR